MKILYISKYDNNGGAAKGAYRLHKGFINNGINSTMLVDIKTTDDHTVVKSSSKLKMYIKNIFKFISQRILSLQKNENTIIHSINLFPSHLHKYINNSDADIVIFHWIGEEMISIKEISKINKPIIWRLADTWAFCGSEHYYLNDNDKRFIDGYKINNRNKNHKGLDIDRLTWQRKVKFIKNKKMTIVTGSNWLAQCAKSSYIFKNKEILTIPSGINTEIYKPINQTEARKILNIPKDKKIILFGSVSATTDKRKGFYLLQKALKILGENFKDSVQAVIFGSSEPKLTPDFGIQVHYLSTLHDDWSLALAYSAADVFVLPTKMDNLPNTIIESMACGTPCISFNIGGLPDMIKNNVNGYLVSPFNTMDLASKIQLLLENNELRKHMGEMCRKTILKDFDVNIQVKRYLKLIENIKNN